MAIVINSTTGEINLSASTLGTYTVTYDTTGATGSICPATSTQSVQLVNTNFNYPTNVCNAAGSPTISPTNFISGQGGTFTISPTSGLTINATSGVLSPASSTAGTYAITYTIGSNSTTKNVTSTNVLNPSTTTNTRNLSFNGTNSYISINDPSLFALGTSDFTISAWVLVTNVPDSYGWIYSQGTQLAFGFNTSGTLRIWVGSTGGFVESTSNISFNNWEHVSVVRVNGVVNFYINGVAAGSGTRNASISAGSYSILGMFNTPTQNPLQGNMDEVAIWDTSLTICDIAGIYQASSNGITADLSTIYPSNLKYYNRMGD